jgi:hypothetical protein
MRGVESKHRQVREEILRSFAELLPSIRAECSSVEKPPHSNPQCSTQIVDMDAYNVLATEQRGDFVQPISGSHATRIPDGTYLALSA